MKSIHFLFKEDLIMKLFMKNANTIKVKVVYTNPLGMPVTVTKRVKVDNNQLAKNK